MKIALNLATRPFSDVGPVIGRLRIGMAVLAVLSVLFAVGLHVFDHQAAAARAREHSLDGQIARIQAERAGDEAMMREPDNALLLEETEALNQLFDAKAFSWTLAMEAMETVLPAGVQVTAIDPARAKDGHITVHMRVIGPHDKAVDLVRNLEHSKRFLQPRIVNESAETGNSPLRQQEPVSASNRFDFDLLAEYNPPTPEERLAAKAAARSAAARTGAQHPKPSLPGKVLEQGRPPYTTPSPKASGKNPTYFQNPSPTPGGPQ
jgi:type IV pilus assembly protein PilN